MSRFFRGDSESESSSSSSSESSSSEDERAPVPRQAGGAAAMRSHRMVSSDESDEDVKRVVKSAKDKKAEELRGSIRTIENGKKINDWVAISNEFDRLVKLMSRMGAESVAHPPRAFVRALAQMEDFVKTTQEKEKETKKKMNAVNAKAFNAMKQKVKKTVKAHESSVEAFRANPVESGSEEHSEKEAPKMEGKKPVAPRAAPVKSASHRFMKKAGASSESESTSSSSSSDSESDSESESSEGSSASESEESSDEMSSLSSLSSEEDDRPKGRSRWLKKEVTSEKTPAAKVVKKPAVVKRDIEKPLPAVAADAANGVHPVGAESAEQAKPQVVYTVENLFKHLREIVDARGKKNTDRVAQMAILEELLRIATTPFQQIRVLLVLLASQFDYNVGTQSYMGLSLWKKAEANTNRLLSILHETDFVVREDGEEPEDESVETKTIRGSVISFVDRLDDEFTKSLQSIDPHSPAYVERLKDEAGLYKTIIRCQAYLERIGAEEALSQTLMRRLAHLYYKPDQVVLALEESTRRKDVDQSDISPEDLVLQFCSRLYRHGAPQLRARAVLYHVYHHALHNRYAAARDLLLMSHMQETVHRADIQTQIHYNRAMVQLGLCAFRLGLVREAHTYLHEINGGGRLKELLGQGSYAQRTHALSQEQDTLDRQTQLPFHMHVNVELVECVYLTCSMLLEIPNLARLGDASDDKKRTISKPFRRLLDYHERASFVGPPETTRDYILASAKSLACGEWESACQFIVKIRGWELLENTEAIKKMLTDQIREEALRTYLFVYGTNYESIRISTLQAMFSLEPARVQAIIARSIFSGELQASMDQVTGLLVMRKDDSSKLQVTASTLAERAVQFLEANEKVFDAKSGRHGRDEGAVEAGSAAHSKSNHRTR